MMEENCKNCKAWEWDGKTDRGRCVRHAPRPDIKVAPSAMKMEKEGLAMQFVWPSTEKGDRCCEFIPCEDAK